MSRASVKKMLVVGVAILGLGLCAAQANAGWWWGAAPSCCGGWDCCGATTYVPCYSACYGGGCHHRAHRCGYGCGWSCCYDPCCCYTPVSCCGTSYMWGTSVVSSCGCGTVVAPAAAAVEGPSMAPAGTPTPAPPKASSAAPALPPPTTTTPDKPAALTPEKPVLPAVTPEKPGGVLPSTIQPVAPDPGINIPPLPKDKNTSIEPVAGDSGVLTVWVPYEAKVTINGLLTKSTGSKRHFVSYGLIPGYTYKYVVKAEVVREGKILTEEQTVSLTAGARNGVAFGFNVRNEELAQSP